MKNILILVLSVVCSISVNAQEMTWVPSKYVPNEGCLDKTSCEDNMVCYKLLYKPSHSGLLTSYTTGFLANCDDKVNAVRLNESCIMNDQSASNLACEDHGLLLLNCSANSGDFRVEANKPYYIHQICVQLTDKTQLRLAEEKITQLTSSIDSDSGPVTELIKYAPYRIMNTTQFCDVAQDNLTLTAELKNEGTVLLSWEPAKERQNGEYILQRSKDGFVFEDIYTSPSMVVNKSSNFKYEHNDLLSEHGEYIYRVLYTYGVNSNIESNQVSIYYKDYKFMLTATPNPAVSKINVIVQSAKEQVELHILDSSGKLISKRNIDTNINTTIDVLDFPAGIYNLVVDSGEEVLSEQMIVIK